MFGIGMPELLIVLVVALLVLGPRKLPEVARSLGRGMAEFRRASTDLRNSLTAPIDDIKETVRDLDPANSSDVEDEDDDDETPSKTTPSKPDASERDG